MNDWFEAGAAAAALDLPALLDASVNDAFHEVVRAGALVSFGLSRDGGALGVTVTADGRWRREWFRESEALATWLLGAYSYLVSASPPAGSTAPGPRSRPERTRSKGR